ncbi:MAG: hypothetical protein M3179_01610 [Actinomycetota bacterium]|nr:hypothetical protein [Actinomycetota bacterium]
MPSSPQESLAERDTSPQFQPRDDADRKAGAADGRRPLSTHDRQVVEPMAPDQALDPQRHVFGIRLAAGVFGRLLRAPVPAWWLVVVLAVMGVLFALVLSLLPPTQRTAEGAAEPRKSAAFVRPDTSIGAASARRWRA